MEFYHIKDSYIDFLRAYDQKVPENKRESRPYVGIVLSISSMNYYAPLSSPKPKHKTMRNAKDFRKIGGGRYGAINFNNMIPVVDEALLYIDIGSIEDARYRNLLQNQYRAVQADSAQIKATAEALHALLLKDDSELSEYEQKLKYRCCDIRRIEAVFQNYQKDGA